MQSTRLLEAKQLGCLAALICVGAAMTTSCHALRRRWSIILLGGWSDFEHVGVVGKHDGVLQDLARQTEAKKL